MKIIIWITYSKHFTLSIFFVSANCQKHVTKHQRLIKSTALMRMIQNDVTCSSGIVRTKFDSSLDR